MPMSFGEAFRELRELKDGKRATRSGWNGKDQWVAVQWPPEGAKIQAPYLYLSTTSGKFSKLVPWAPNQLDLFATDWEILKESA